MVGHTEISKSFGWETWWLTNPLVGKYDDYPIRFTRDLNCVSRLRNTILEGYLLVSVSCALFNSTQNYSALQSRIFRRRPGRISVPSHCSWETSPATSIVSVINHVFCVVSHKTHILCFMLHIICLYVALLFDICHVYVYILYSKNIFEL